MTNNRSRALRLGLFLAIASLGARTSWSREGGETGLPQFSLDRLRVSDIQASEAPVPAASSAPVPEPAGQPQAKGPTDYQKLIDANEKLADIVAKLDLSEAPPEIQEALRAQAKALAKGTRRLPAFVRTARKVIKARDFLDRHPWIAKSLGLDSSSAPAEPAVVIGALASRIGELVQGVSGQDEPKRANGQPLIPPGTDPCTAFRIKLRAAEEAHMQGKPFDPYSSLNLANIALTVAFNNMAMEIHQLMPEELMPLVGDLNSAAEVENIPGIDAKTMQSLKLLMKQAFDKDSKKFDQSVVGHLENAPEDFKKKAQEILALGVYNSPEAQTAEK